MVESDKANKKKKAPVHCLRCSSNRAYARWHDHKHSGQKKDALARKTMLYKSDFEECPGEGCARCLAHKKFSKCI